MADLRKNPFFLDKITNLYARTKKVPVNRGDLFRDYIAVIAKDSHWFGLQNWMLGLVGLYMTYIQKTSIPGIIGQNALFLGLATVPKQLLKGDDYVTSDSFDLDVQIGDRIRAGDQLAHSKENRENVLLARTDGLVANIEEKYLFSVALDFDELDRSKVSASLRQQLQEHGAVLTPQARVEVKRAGSSWIIVSGDENYLIRNDNQRLNVYKGKTLTLEIGDLLKSQCDEYQISFAYELTVKDGDQVKVGDQLAYNRKQTKKKIEARTTGRIAVGDDGTFRIEPLIYGPEETESLLTQLGKKTICNNKVFAEFVKRFDAGCRESVWTKFEELLDRIRTNGYFEPDKTARFMHQSIQEYFAALRFAQLYEQDPKYLDDFIRFRKFDEMLHIVIGCVFEEKLHIIRDILHAMVKVSHLKEVRDCLSKAEHIDDPARAILPEEIGRFIYDPLSPDQARAVALECLPYLIKKEECTALFVRFLSELDLGERTAAWHSLLNVTYSQCSENRFRRLLELGLDRRNHRDELLIATAKWVRANRHQFLVQYLIKKLECAITPESNPKVSKAIWQAIKGLPFEMGFDDWASILDQLDEPQLFSEILTYKHEDRQLHCRLYFTEARLAKAVQRFSATETDWHIPLGSILRMAREADRLSPQIISQVIEICMRRKEFPTALLDQMWQMDAATILDLEIDLRTLEWCLNQELDRRPAGIGKRVSQCLEQAVTDRAIMGHAKPPCVGHP